MCVLHTCTDTCHHMLRHSEDFSTPQTEEGITHTCVLHTCTDIFMGVTPYANGERTSARSQHTSNRGRQTYMEVKAYIVLDN